LIRVNPVDLDRALQRWNTVYGANDQSLAIDGKTMCNAIDIQGKDITADALLTQRKLADSLCLDRKAHYHFTVKGNQATLFQDIPLYFQDRTKPDFIAYDPPDHGRIETRKIWTTTDLNSSLDFPHVQQAFVIERESVEQKTGHLSHDIAYGISSRKPHDATPQQLLAINRGHWSIENCCHDILDCNFDEDRSRIRTGYGPENISRLRRFAIGVIKAKRVRRVAQKMRELTCQVRLVFDYLRMTKHSCASARLQKWASPEFPRKSSSPPKPLAPESTGFL
jgi:predicted transposase YbfD/YdcC